MSRYVGVDACRAGWFAVELSGDQWRFALYTHISTLWAYHRKAQMILIDMPIGLPEDGYRACDIEARALLKGRASSVFMTPVRAAVYAVTYADACERSLAHTGKKISKQAWNITPRIREIDSFLRIEPPAQAVIRESHPELMFSGLAGRVIEAPKRTRDGQAARLEVLGRFFPQAQQLLSQAQATYRRREVTTDDVLDALALAVGARTHHLLSLPAGAHGDDCPRDAHGLPMQIIYVHEPRVQRLHHAQITIPPGEEDAARHFYCDILGMVEIPKPGALAGRGGFWLRLGSVELHISPEQTPDPDQRYHTKAHLAYQVGDLAYWRGLLAEHGITILESVPIPGYQRFELRDPFGNRVELIQPESAGDA